jgi:tetratricopeptide (TPR) repeat protein
MGEGRLERARQLRSRADTMLASAGWLAARDLYRDALDAFVDEGAHAEQAACLRGLGDVARQLEEPKLAREQYQRALEIERELGAAAGEADTLLRLAELERVGEQWQPAWHTLEQAAERYRAAGQRAGQARCLGLMGEVAHKLERSPDEVLRLYLEARDLQLQLDDRRGAAVTLTFMAHFLQEQGQEPRAAAAFAQAAELYDALGLHHRAQPFRAAARRLDPSLELADPDIPRAAWDED